MARKRMNALLTGPKLALAGRVVTMNETSTVLPRGVIYLEAGRIVAVADASTAAPAPPGFAAVEPVDVGGRSSPA